MRWRATAHPNQLSFEAVDLAGVPGSTGRATGPRMPTLKPLEASRTWLLV
jgi:hypothetical protein